MAAGQPVWRQLPGDEVDPIDGIIWTALAGIPLVEDPLGDGQGSWKVGIDQCAQSLVAASGR